MCVLVGWMIGVDLLILFLSSKDDTPEDTPDPRWNFSQLASLTQQLRTSGSPLGGEVQAASVKMSPPLSIYGLGGEVRQGKFNFGVVSGGGDMDLVDMEVWKRLDFCLGRIWSLPRIFH